VNHTVPSIPSVVDDDVDLAVAELCSLLHKRVEVLVVEHVAWGGDGFATALVDGIGDALCLFCFGIVVSRDFLGAFSSSFLIERNEVKLAKQRDSDKMLGTSLSILTTINITHNNLCPLIGEQPRGLSSNALTRASNNRNLAMEHALGVVEVSSDLLRACVGHVSSRR
jgi:hypothetical protein